MSFPIDFPYGGGCEEPPDGVYEEEGVYPSFEVPEYFPFV